MKVYSKEELNNYSLSLTYDDISLIPHEISEIKSRSDVHLNTKFLGREMRVPVISSPMDTVTGIELAKTLKETGAIGILNRFDSSLDTFLNYDKATNQIDAVSVKLTETDEVLEKLAAMEVLICIDTANAANHEVLKKCEDIKKKWNPKVCTTSVQTGIGIGQVSSVLDVYFTREKENLDIEIIADGGIKSAGDVAKAIALGADIVMLGRMLAGTKETPGEVIKYADQLWKKYRGSASFGVKMKGEFIEGEETMVPYKGTVRNVINSISDGVKSTLSYLNCKDLESLRKTEMFTVLSNSSYLERLPKK